MNLNFNKLIEKKINVSKTVKWKFSDLCENIVEKTVPKQSGLDHYIGLKHLDSGSLKIKRFGKTSNLDGEKLKIYKGDIIFAKRNAYLKRVAISDFDAVASAHSMVLRAKSKNILPKFLPFFLLSETFWQKAIEISVGSLSPTINWKSLAKEEFFLPTKEEQAKLARLFWSINSLIESELKLSNQFIVTKKSIIQNLYSNNNIDFKIVSLNNISKLITKGTTPSSLGASFVESGINFIKIESLTPAGDFIKNKIEHIDSSTHKKLKRSQLEKNDIIFSIAGALGRCALITKSICPANTNQALAIIRLKEFINPGYVLEYLRSDNIMKHINKVNVKGAQANLSLKNINEFQLPLPSIKIQNEIFLEVQKLNLILEKIKNKVSFSKLLLKSLINKVFNDI